MRTALIVIDMLNDFVDGVLGNPAAEQLVGPIASLAERARGSHDWVVVYVNDAHQLNDVELQGVSAPRLGRDDGCRRGGRAATPC